MAFARNLVYRCPVRRMEYLALEKIYASDLRVFATEIIRFVWNIPSISRDSKNERFATLVLLLFILFYLFIFSLLLVVSISWSDTLKNLSWLRIFTTFYTLSIHFLYKIGGHVCRHFVVKQRAYCRLVTEIDGEETIKTLCSVMRKPSSDSWSIEQIK